MKTCLVHVNGDLQFFIAKKHKEEKIRHTFIHKTTIRDVASSLGILPPEIQVILLNGKPASIDSVVDDNDFITLDSGSLSADSFILDVHLGKLARYIRMLGFDSFYRNDLADDEIIEIAHKENRAILTRDTGILKNKKVRSGYFLRNTMPELQLKEVITIFNLSGQFKSFSRCMNCNGKLAEVEKRMVKELVPTGAWLEHDQFFQCEHCHQVYWKGTHFYKMQDFISRVFFIPGMQP